MTALTGVGGIVSAAHRARDGRLHGHTWEILAWFPAGRNAVDLKAALDSVLAAWDHGELPDALAWGEDLASAIGGALAGCVQVDVARPAERIFARWHAAGGGI